MNEELVAAIVQRTIDQTSRRWTKRVFWLLWLAAACTAIAIIFTDWRWFALAVLQMVIAGIHMWVIYWEQQPDMQRKIATEIRRKLATDPDWRPKDGDRS